MESNDLTIVINEQKPKFRNEGKIIGVDSGFGILAVDNEGNRYFPKFGRTIAVWRTERAKSLKQGEVCYKRIVIKMIEASKEIVKDAKIVVAEHISDIRRGLEKNGNTDSIFYDWPYQEWLDILEETCRCENVKFVKVVAVYTSQICSRCSYKDEKNRIANKFKCLKCRLELNAHHNAAINIRNLYLAQEREAASTKSKHV